ncbi:hypothetical protein NYR55_13680 [Sphingomonas sp. BGYR3]|uniref:hypothetical protein n=1 Tax=Sphingomonas sp. BGYR3 TaxID=2975483 RepID=UPI0021A308BF|nr:hypothetical protein [Sphingomonas sp. BGYR3]MDG5489669.1 hypothetical protein [Sphingomonas sp. BGYR3]
MQVAARLSLLLVTLGGCVAADPVPPVTRASGEAAVACPPTRSFRFVCDAAKPEDLVGIPGSPWLVASGFSEGAGLKLIDRRDPVARPWFTGAADQVDRDPQLTDCTTPPDAATFTTRGLSIRAAGPGRAVLHVVAHGQREAIERFDILYGSVTAWPRIVWRGCMRLPADHVGNSVATAPDGTLLVTVLTRPGTTITDFVRGQTTGIVLERRPGDQQFRELPGTALQGNNGIETSLDGRSFYVVSFGTREIVAFDRSDTRQPLWRVTAPEFMPDNIRMQGGRLIAAGMVRDEPACGGPRRIVDGMADGMVCHRGWTVAALDPATRQFTLVAYGEPDPVFNGVSAAWIADGQLWLGSYQSDRIAVRAMDGMN